LNIPPELRELRPYLQYRGLFVVFVSTVYYFSYVRDWHFSRISLVLCTVGVTGLVMIFSMFTAGLWGPCRRWCWLSFLYGSWAITAC
jgi:hypothetical protein